MHEAAQIPTQSIVKSWNETQTYIKEMIEYLEVEWNQKTKVTGSYYEFCFGNEVLHHLYEESGNPPEECSPIYIITTGNNKAEEIVYIGQTSSESNRFKGGHLAALKLHHPDYSGFEKRVYFATIMLLTKSKEYIPLEYVYPLEKAKFILSKIEAGLIYHFQPALNIQHKSKENYKISSQIHIQNFTEHSIFLDNQFVSIWK